MVISLIFHTILLVIAITFVAVTVIKRDDVDFEAVRVDRPRVPLKKLQVPVEMRKKRPAPKLRRRIVVKQTKKMPEIQLPEITGVKGGVGSAGSGLGGTGGIGFSMPEVKIFGIKDRGEKLFFILDIGPHMLRDERGGIPAFSIIKNELLGIIEEIPSSALFNIVLYDDGSAYLLSPQLMSASAENVKKARAWLGPLNEYKEGMGDKDYGVKTLGEGGAKVGKTYGVDPIKSERFWLRPALIAMEQQADVIYVLAGGFGTHKHRISTTKGEKVQKAGISPEEANAKAQRMFQEENDQRRAKGLPPRVFASKKEMRNHYVKEPIAVDSYRYHKTNHEYSNQEMIEVMLTVRGQYAPPANKQLRLGRKRNKEGFTLNVIHFIQQGSKEKSERFIGLAKDLNGDYRTLAGLKAIQFSASQ